MHIQAFIWDIKFYKIWKASPLPTDTRLATAEAPPPCRRRGSPGADGAGGGASVKELPRLLHRETAAFLGTRELATGIELKWHI